MRRHPCSKCGLACYSTSKPAICKACLSGKKKALGNHSQHHATITRAQSLEIISPLQQRVSNNEISTILHCGISEQKQESNAVSYNQSSIQIQDQSCIKPSLELSLSQGDQETSTETKSPHKENSSCIWSPRVLQKRKRSKLPQYVLSPMERFVNQLGQAAICQKKKGISVDEGRHSLLDEEPKYDDVLIYEKCKLIPDNEIGLGAVLLSPSVPSTKCYKPEPVQVKTEPYTKEDYASSVLFDVPIRDLSE